MNEDIKKLDIPYKNFQTGQIIDSQQMNDDMRVIEHKVNQMITDYNDSDGVTEEEIHTLATTDELFDASNTYATSDMIANILNSSANQEIADALFARGVRGVYITEEEIIAIVRGDENA